MRLRCKAAVPFSELEDTITYGYEGDESIGPDGTGGLARVSVLIEEGVASSLEVLSRKDKNGYTMYVDIRVMNTDKGSYFLGAFIGSSSASVLEWAVYDFDEDELSTKDKSRRASILVGYSVFKATIMIAGVGVDDLEAAAALSAFGISGVTIVMCLNKVHRYSYRGNTGVGDPTLPQVARNVVGLFTMKEVGE